MNVLLIMADQHRRDAMGAVGHPVVQTPHLDKLAEGGWRFTSAYCNSPLCGPSRASFVTGKYVHEIGCWDQLTHYNGRPGSWGDYLSASNVKVTTIGKLDFQEGVIGGFPDQRLVQHRKPKEKQADAESTKPKAPAEPKKPFGVATLEQAGPGDYWVSRLERETGEAVRFLHEEAARETSPWVLWLNYLPPHFPYIAPQSYYDQYPHESVDLPFDFPSNDHHPVTEEHRRRFYSGEPDEETVKRVRAAYYGLCTFVDDQVGQVLEALEKSGLSDNTLVIYTSDHGDHLGDHELWMKSSMYEQSAGIPLIMSAPGLGCGVANTPVSLVDVSATIADAVGLALPADWRGISLLPLLCGQEQNELQQGRIVLSEYHAHGLSHSVFMIRKGRYKYVYHPQNPAQLFDLEVDPYELNNIAHLPESCHIVTELHQELTRIVDPDQVDEYVRMECKPKHIL